MPKTHKRRKSSAKTSSGQSRSAAATQTRTSSENVVKTVPVSNAAASNTRTALRNRPFFSPKVTGPQSLIMPGMVAAGCWLMAYTVIYLTNDTYRYALGVMAVLMALLWTFSFAMRARKLMMMRQRPRS